LTIDNKKVPDKSGTFLFFRFLPNGTPVRHFCDPVGPLAKLQLTQQPGNCIGRIAFADDFKQSMDLATCSAKSHRDQRSKTCI